MGRARRAPAGAIRRWKAPRVQRIAFPFAGVRVRRPCPRNRDRKEAELREAEIAPERANRSQARSCQEEPEGTSATQAILACARREPRQEVSEPNGLG